MVRKLIIIIGFIIGLLYMLRDYIPYQSGLANKELNKIDTTISEENHIDAYWITQEDYKYICDYGHRYGPSLSIRTPSGAIIEYTKTREPAGYHHGKPIYSYTYTPKKPLKIKQVEQK